MKMFKEYEEEKLYSGGSEDEEEEEAGFELNDSKEDNEFFKYTDIDNLIIQKHIFYGYRGDTAVKVYALTAKVCSRQSMDTIRH